jgi:hypothetical protein
VRKPVVRPHLQELEPRTALNATEASLPGAAAGLHGRPITSPSYTIIAKDLGQGQRAQVNAQTTNALRITVADATGKVLGTRQDTTGDTFAYRETILTKPPGPGCPRACRGAMTRPSSSTTA